MYLVFHGGLCCGIKTVYGFPYGTGIDFARKCPVPGVAEQKPHGNPDRQGRPVQSDLYFYTEKLPAETTEERLVRYIKFMEEHRPRNILEATLITPCQDGAIALLEEYGFKKVNQWENSNSGNTVVVLHKNIEGPVVAEEEDDDYEDFWECEDDEF